MAGELRLNEVATPTTPAAGKDSLYMSSETLPRLRRVDSAGTVWPVSEIIMQCLSADYTLSDSASAQAAFNGSAAGSITLPGSSSYLLEAYYLLTNTGTTSHTWSVLFAGTATLTSLDFTTHGRSGATSLLTLTADSSASQANAAGSLPTTALAVTAASTSATENVTLNIQGALRINAGGTFIPQIKASAQPNGTEKMLRGSWIKLTPFGSNTAVYLGNWS